MATLETKIKAIKELQDEIDALYRIIRAKNCKLSNEAQDEILMNISIKTKNKETLVNEIDEVLAIAGLTTRRIK